jgi:hypothetical protein
MLKRLSERSLKLASHPNKSWRSVRMGKPFGIARKTGTPSS